MSSRRTNLSCHRGANLIAPENTFAAARGAIALGADFIEIDVRISADGVLYILHDETVDRTTDGTGAVKEMGSADLDRLDAGSWFSSEFSGERLPRLDQYMSWLSGQTGIYVEIKQAPVEPVRDLVYEHGFADNCYLLSMDRPIAADLVRLAPDLPVMGLLRQEGSIQAVADKGFRIVELIASELTEENVELARQHDLKIQVFHPKDDETVFRAMIKAEIDFANVDHPETFQRIRGETASGTAV